MIMFVLLNDVSWKRERKFMMVIMKETWRWGATTVQQRYSGNWSGYILNHVLAPVNVCVWAIVCVGGTLLSWRAASTEMLHNSINNPPSEQSGALRVTTIQELHQRSCEDWAQPNQLRSGKWLKKRNNQKKKKDTGIKALLATTGGWPWAAHDLGVSSYLRLCDRNRTDASVDRGPGASGQHTRKQRVQVSGSQPPTVALHSGHVTCYQGLPQTTVVQSEVCM